MSMTKAADALCIKFAKVEGTTAATDITLTGAVDGDTIIMCLAFPDNTTADPIDRTGVASITGDDVMQTSTATADEHLAVLWLDRSA